MADARFDRPLGFTKINKTTIIVSDTYNKCLRFINLAEGTVGDFSGRCGEQGDKDGIDGKYKRPRAIIQDNQNSDRLFVSDDNHAVRTANVNNGEVGTFVQMDIFLRLVDYMTQHENGDLYVSSYQAISHIPYNNPESN